MSKFDFSEYVKFVKVDSIRRFDFVDNETLRENLSINTQYIVFLVSLELELKLPGGIECSLFKNIIIYCASIVESLINYKLQKLLKEKRTTNERLLKKSKKYKNEKMLYKISEHEKVCGVIAEEVCLKISDDTQFIDLNKASKRCGLFDDKLFKQAEDLRKMRNKIHLKGLKKIDNQYSKKDINKIFLIMKNIIDRVRDF